MVAEDQGRIHWKEGDMVLESRSWEAWGDFSQGLDELSQLSLYQSVCHIRRH